jgi:hypothetical protein
MTTYTSTDKTIIISIRQQNGHKIAWACHVEGKYIKTKVLPKNNTAIPQNFGYAAKDFTLN